MGKKMTVVEIRNICKQCGDLTSISSIDRSPNGGDMTAITKDAIERQKKEVIEPNHVGHDYKLTININQKVASNGQ